MKAGAGHSRSNPQQQGFFLLGDQCNHTFIGDVYRLRNSGKLNLETIEVHSGSTMAEEATGRLEVSWDCSKLVKEA